MPVTKDQWVEELHNLAEDIMLSGQANFDWYAQLLKANRLNAEQLRRIKQLHSRARGLLRAIAECNADHDIPYE